MPCRMATGGYKVTKFHPVCKGIGVAHSTVSISRAVQPWEREGAMLSSVSEGGKDGRLRDAGNSRENPGTSEETIPEGQASAKASGRR